MLRLSCQLPWFHPRSRSRSRSRSCPQFAPLPWKLPFVRYWSCMFACTFASVQFATDCRTISPLSIRSNNAMWQASWACAATPVGVEYESVEPLLLLLSHQIVAGIHNMRKWLSVTFHVGWLTQGRTIIREDHHFPSGWHSLPIFLEPVLGCHLFNGFLWWSLYWKKWPSFDDDVLVGIGIIP